VEQAVSGKDFTGFGHGFGEKVFPVEFKLRVGDCHRFGSCAFGGIEITTIFVLSTGKVFARREALSIPGAPEG
jgi:hypothetical protein